MSTHKSWFYKLSLAAAASSMVLISAGLMHGQTSTPPRVPMMEDWSTHHLVFSHPGTFEQATQTRPFLEWYKVLSDPRYQMELARRNADLKRGAGGASGAVGGDDADDLKWGGRLPPHRPRPLVAEPTKPEGDWNNFLGGTANAGIGATLYPAKYTWNINAPPNCTSDFLVVPVNQAPANVATAAGSVVIEARPATSNTVTLGGIIYTFSRAALTAPTSGCSVYAPASTTNDATYLYDAITGGGTQTTTTYECATGYTPNPAVTAPAHTTNTVTLDANTTNYPGVNGNSVALATNNDADIYLNGSAQLTATLAGGKDGQASIIAFNNLYAGGGATQTGTVASNPASGGTVTITLTNPTTPVTLTASAPTDETATITVGTTKPANTSAVIIGSVTYTFETANIATAPATGCEVYSATGTTGATNLDNAIAHAGAQGNTTYRCAASITTANSAVNASRSTATITLTATTAGSTGFTFAETGTTNFTTFGSTAGTNGTTSGTAFAYWSGAAAASTTQLAANIAAAINANSTLEGAAGVTATSSGPVITVAANTGGTAGDAIALASGLSGFAWGGTTLAGGSTAGMCGSGQPTVMWAYNASTASSPMLGSPILSYDGTKVAFIESASGGAILHVLNWRSGDGGTNLIASPVAPSTLETSTACGTTPSCMFSLTLGTYNNTNSPPFYDYNTDALFVGDNNGTLRKVTGVFGGTPAVAWSATVNSGAILSGAVEDISNGNILVGDSTGRLSMVSSAGVVSGTTLTGLGDITDPVMVDPFTGHVFVFSGGNGTSAVVEEATTSLTSPVAVNIGYNSATTHVHVGMFDNIYYSSANNTGNLYVCGRQAGNAAPALYSVPISAGVMTGTVNGPLDLSTTTTAQECSPLSEVYNPSEGADWLFVGVPANCAFGGATGGCIMSFDITSGTIPTTAAATAAENGGTSGIVVDNVSPSAQASSAYFTTLASPGAGGCTQEPSGDSTTCLVKRTQQGLQ